MRLISFFFIVFLSFLPGCRTDKSEPDDFRGWRAAGETINILKETGGSNRLDKILFLDDIYGNFDYLRVDRRPVHEIYRYSLPAIEVKKGSSKKRRRTLDISGDEIILQLALDNDLMTSRSLNLLELDIGSRDDLVVKVFAFPRGDEENTKRWGPWGIFIHEFFSPGEAGKSRRTMTLDLAQRFGLHPIPMGRLTVKISGAGEVRQSVKLRLNSVRLLSPNVFFTRTTPALDYHRYGGAERRRLKSVFFPAGSEVSYTIDRSPQNDTAPVLIDGYLGSVDGRDIRFEIRVNGSVILSRDVGPDIAHFREKIPSAVAGGPLVLNIDITGEPGRVGFLGNMSVYHPLEERRNVVIYLIDALRADMGGIRTPLFEEFEDAAVFSNAYANATATPDSLPSLFTGKYKFTLVERPSDNPFVSNRETLLAEYFKRKGYMTAAFINNPWLDLSNSSRGFDQIYFCWNPLDNGQISPMPTASNYRRHKYGDMEEFLDAFISAQGEKPVFLYFHTMEPHVPYETPLEDRVFSKGASPEILERLFRHFTETPHSPTLVDPSDEELTTLLNVYRDAVLMSSRHFKKIHDMLFDRAILHDSSLLVLCSDHGERFYEHGSWIHGGADVYNEVLQIPLMMKGKNIRPGVYGHGVQLLDIFPTIMDWMGDEPAPMLHGWSLLRYLEDLAKAPRAQEPWRDRVIYADGMGQEAHYAVIRGDIKIIIQGSRVEIYDLAEDPGETQNLASHPGFEEMIAEARTFQDGFRKSAEKLVRDISAEEKERLRSLGYLW